MSKANNAWSRPLSSNIAAPPGLSKTNGQKPAATTVTPTSTGSKPSLDSALRSRFLLLTLSLVGQQVTLHHVNGSILTGVLHTFTPFREPTGHANVYVLKSVQVTQRGPDDSLKLETGGTLLVHSSDVASVVCASVRLDNPPANAAAASSGFRTDGDISRSGAASGAELEKASGEWTKSAPSTTPRGGGLEDGSGKRKGMFGTATTQSELRGGIGQWDQFQANEDQFGVTATYDENLYTTELAKGTVAQRKQAERLAKEIEGQVTSNLHQAEERGHKIEGDFDEEDLYSGVLVKDEEGEKDKKTERTKLVLKPRTVDKEAPSKDAAVTKENKADIIKEDTLASNQKVESKKSESAPSTTSKTAPVVASSVSPPKMNYAAVVAKVKKSKAAAVPAAENKSDPAPTTVADSTSPASGDSTKKADSKSEITKATDTALEKDTTSASSESKDDKKSEKAKSKLNANAKSFTFNPSAKTFTPSFAAPAPPSAEPQALHTGAMGGIPPGAPQPQHAAYMPYVQPVVISNSPMMYQPYGPVRGYPGAAPYMVPPPQQQHQPPTANEGAVAPGTEESEGGTNAGVEQAPATNVTDETPMESDDAASTPDAASTSVSGSGATTPSTQGQAQQSQGQPQQPQQMYGVNQYYPAPTAMGRGMPTQGNVYPQMAVMGRGYHPQMMGGPQQPIMHQGGIPQYNQMRGPGGFPYMQGGYSGPGGQMHGGGMDGNDMGGSGGGGYGGSNNGGGGGRGGRTGRGSRRGGRKGGGGGRGRGGYNNNYNTNGGGYQTQYHQGPSSDQAPEPQSKGESSS